MAHKIFLRPEVLATAALLSVALVYQIASGAPVRSFFGGDQQESSLRVSDQGATDSPVVQSTGSNSAPASKDPVVETDPAPHAPVSKEDSERFEELEELLSSIPTGREALRLMHEYRVRVEFRSGEGTRYSIHHNLVVIESSTSTAGSLFSIVHEMTHAARHHQGMRADPRVLSREAYIYSWLEEEAEGDARAIEAKIELEAVGFPVSEEAAWLEKQYLRAYRARVTSPKTEQGEPTGEAPEVLGRQAGKKAVIEGYRSGLAVTSTNLDTYASWYGQHWDEVNLVDEAK